MQHGYRQSNTRLEPQICCTSAGVLPTSDHLLYDEDKEFEDKLDEVVLENAKVIALTGNNAFFCEKTAFGR